MSQLIPCPGCHRHVRQHESACPFCNSALSLEHLPAPAMPRARLGRAATFAFGATLAGATALVGCGGDSEEGKEGGGGTGGASAGASSGGSSSGGSTANAGNSNGGSTVGPVYGAPAAGTGGDSASGGNGMGGGASALYGAPPSGGTENNGGTGNPVPVYGAAPAD